MVRRLIQEEQIGTLIKQGGEDRAHLPPAAELGERAPFVLGRKAEAGEDGFGFMLRIMRLEMEQLFMKLTESDAERGELFFACAFLCPSLELRLFLLDGAADRLTPRHTAQHIIEKSFLAFELDVLREIADAHVARDDHLAAIGSILTREQLQEAALSGTVWTDQPDPFALGDAEIEVLDDGLAPEVEGAILKDDEAHSLRVLKPRARRCKPPPRVRRSGLEAELIEEPFEPFINPLAAQAEILERIVMATLVLALGCRDLLELATELRARFEAKKVVDALHRSLGVAHQIAIVDDKEAIFADLMAELHGAFIKIDGELGEHAGVGAVLGKVRIVRDPFLPPHAHERGDGLVRITDEVDVFRIGEALLEASEPPDHEDVLIEEASVRPIGIEMPTHLRFVIRHEPALELEIVLIRFGERQERFHIGRRQAEVHRIERKEKRRLILLGFIDAELVDAVPAREEDGVDAVDKA